MTVKSLLIFIRTFNSKYNFIFAFIAENIIILHINFCRRTYCMIISYQFVKFKEDAFVKYHKQLAEMNTVTCFDFEDSIIDFKTNDTNKYKSDYREKIVTLLRKYKSQILKTWVGFRINEYGSNKYFDDLESIRKIERFKPRCIFISNCNSVDVLEKFITENSDLRYGEVIPIIEDRQSPDELEQLFQFKHPKFKTAAFGHCDFNMNCNIFPFIHQDNPQYWQWVETFAALCKAYEKGFINSQYLNINHSDRFKLMLKHTSQYLDDWGQITLNTQQSMQCYYFTPETCDVKEIEPAAEVPAAEYAQHIVELFEKYNPDGRGYTIMPGTNIFISPQEYITAKRFLCKD